MVGIVLDRTPGVITLGNCDEVLKIGLVAAEEARRRKEAIENESRRGVEGEAGAIVSATLSAVVGGGERDYAEHLWTEVGSA